MRLIRETKKELVYMEGNLWGYLITGLLLIICGFVVLYYYTGEQREFFSVFSEIVILIGIAALLATGKHTIIFNKSSATVTFTRNIFFLHTSQQWNLSEIREVQLDKWAIHQHYFPIPFLGKIGGGGFVPQLRLQFHDRSVQYLNYGRRMKYFGFTLSKGERSVGKKIASFLNIPYSEFEKDP